LTGEVNTGQQTALTLPESAITMRDGNAYVFAVIKKSDKTDQHSVKQIKVGLGRQRGDSIEVLGITQSNDYILSGGAFLNDGDVVRVLASTEPAP